MTMMTAAQVCKEMHISRTTLHRWRTAFGFPPPLKVGHTIRFDIQEVEAWASKRKGNEEETGD